MNSSSNGGLNLSTTNDGLEQLKHLFHEHFELGHATSYDEYRLDYASFNEIFRKWIRQLNCSDAINSEFNMASSTSSSSLASKTQPKSKKPFNFAAKNSYFYSKKHQYSKMSQMNATSDEEYTHLGAASSSTRSSSSIPSVSESDAHLISEFETNLQNLAETSTTSSNSSFLIGDLTSENRQLKQVISDLRSQLQNAEDTNAQMVHEIELQAEKIYNATRLNAELSAKLDAHLDENDYLRKQADAHKSIARDFESQYNVLSSHVKSVSASLRKSEEELLKVGSMYQDSEVDKFKLFDELTEQKVTLMARRVFFFN